MASIDDNVTRIGVRMAHFDCYTKAIIRNRLVIVVIYLGYTVNCEGL